MVNSIRNSTIALTALMIISSVQLLAAKDATSSRTAAPIGSSTTKGERSQGEASNRSREPRASSRDVTARRFGYNNRWNNRDDESPSLENDIEHDEISKKQTHKSQENYVCGRAIANKKYKDSLLRDQNYQQSVNRAKYRPTEIRMPRIIGGDETTPGEFPWAASVKLNGQPICGGSLIDKNWILTAAHCVVGYNPKNLTVRLGAYRIKDSSESQTVDLPVSMFIVHKEYSMPRPFSNDIALLKLLDSVEFTDYIIPICLPTEDQVTTSTSAIVVNDYSNQFDSSAKDAEDSGGIVISTKMSDHEITRCFNKLEQNYLNSIGLGAIGESSTTTTSATASESHSPTSLPAAGAAAAAMSPPQVSSVSMQPSAFVKQQPSQTSAQSSATNHKSFSYANLVDPIFMATDDGENNNYNSNGNKDRLHDMVTSSHQHQQQQQQQQALHHHHQAYKPIVGVGGQQHYSFALADASSNSFEPTNYDPDASYIYYPGMPWAIESSNSRGDGDDSARKETVKLSRLPISKEILREIQSVGSGQLPTLNLGIQQGDFVAMASDLTQSNSMGPTIYSSGSGGGTNSDFGSVFAGDSNNSGSGGNSDVNGNTNSNSNSGFSVGRREQVFSNRQYIRSAMDEEGDDATKAYSGLSGTVVGWGWVREFDGEDPISNKGYPSVTLQKVKLPILRNNVCEAWFQSQSKKITLLPSQFCAGFSSGGKDACRGDSGGPMIIEDNSDTGRYKLIGIVSAGIGCARPSLPGLYTRVASFLPWINAQLMRY